PDWTGFEEERKALLERLVHGDISVRRAAFDANDAAPAEIRALSDLEVDLLCGRLQMWHGREGRADMRHRVDSRLRASPSSPEALLLSAGLHGLEGVPVAAEREMIEAARVAPGDENAARSLFRASAWPAKGMRRSAERRARAERILAEWLPKARWAA